MLGEWHPINDNHAINVMAAVFSFAQPIPGLLLKKALTDSEQAAFAAGLRSRHSLRGMQFTLGTDGGAVGATTPLIAGQMFNSLADAPEGAPASAQLAEQLVVQDAQIVYRTWRYVSWSWQRERIKKLVVPALDAVHDAVSIASQRLEYLDRFRFDGAPSNADPSLLFKRDSAWIAHQVFSRSDLWHSHTGAFLPGGKGAKRLVQVHIDAVEEPISPEHGAPQARWINIMTAREDRFQGLDEGARSTDLMLGLLDELHSELKGVLGEVLTDSMARRIYLNP